MPPVQCEKDLLSAQSTSEAKVVKIVSAKTLIRAPLSRLLTSFSWQSFSFAHLITHLVVFNCFLNYNLTALSVGSLSLFTTLSFYYSLNKERYRWAVRRKCVQITRESH